LRRDELLILPWKVLNKREKNFYRFFCSVIRLREHNNFPLQCLISRKLISNYCKPFTRNDNSISLQSEMLRSTARLSVIRPQFSTSYRARESKRFKMETSCSAMRRAVIEKDFPKYLDYKKEVYISQLYLVLFTYTLTLSDRGEA
jgi:hypothetical protein